MNRIKAPILERAEFFADNMKEYNIHSAILLILYDLRIPLNYEGFAYLKQAILVACQNPGQIVLSEVLERVRIQSFPAVSIHNMDTAIREAIRKAWKLRLDDRWGRYCPDYFLERKKPPSNLEFIAAIVYFLELWQNCYVKEADYESA